MGLDIYRLQEGLSEIVSGGALGIDTIAEQYAETHGIPSKIFLADWQEKGKQAGFIRNNEIWEYADEGVAFWDGKSKGTAHSFQLAKRHKKTLIVFQGENLVKYIKMGVEVL